MLICFIYIYIYIYRERERGRERDAHTHTHTHTHRKETERWTKVISEIGIFLCQLFQWVECLPMLQETRVQSKVDAALLNTALWGKNQV